MRVAGIGFRAHARPASLADALARAGAADALAVIADKANHAAFRAFAAGLGLPVIIIPREDLAGIETATHSPRVHAMLGAGSAAEALALAALRPGAWLVSPRVLSEDRSASAAIAAGDSK